MLITVIIKESDGPIIVTGLPYRDSYGCCNNITSLVSNLTNSINIALKQAVVYVFSVSVYSIHGHHFFNFCS